MTTAAIQALEIAAIAVAGTMTGNEIAVAVFVHPRISRLEDEAHVKAAQTLASGLGAAMPFWYALTLLLSLAVETSQSRNFCFFARLVKALEETSDEFAIPSSALRAAGL